MSFILYCWEILHFACTTAWGISESVGTIVGIIVGIIIWKYPRKEPTVKHLPWMIPLYCFLAILIIRILMAPYVLYTKQQDVITKLQNVQAQKEHDTKQDIRSFLESINPGILTKVDAKEKTIGIWLSSVNQTRIALLADRTEFEKYLSFKKGANVWIVAGEGEEEHNGLIKGAGENGTLTDYYLYPKDALIK